MSDVNAVQRAIDSMVKNQKRGYSFKSAQERTDNDQDAAKVYVVSQVAALKSRLESGKIGVHGYLAALGRVLSKLHELDIDEEDPQMEAVLDALEEAILDATGTKEEEAEGTKPEAKTATKSRGDYHPAFDVALKYASGGSPSHDIDEGDAGRDFFGRRVSPLPEDLRDDDGDDDEYPTDAGDEDGRDLYGRRTSPLNGRR